ncbi:hypothetical protein FRUB_07849 [Fimbriiglobus ruber]|uniref:Uncharacterized protein n=1 Tax=Fimbriiglobus ruber TaxID=1908690 RepID=A0A225DNC8_9BACT|nr:hypothetical protein FRUB_07849 [Fimbriiglobus ruber]
MDPNRDADAALRNDPGGPAGPSRGARSPDTNNPTETGDGGSPGGGLSPRPPGSSNPRSRGTRRTAAHSTHTGAGRRAGREPRQRPATDRACAWPGSVSPAVGPGSGGGAAADRGPPSAGVSAPTVASDDVPKIVC